MNNSCLKNLNFFRRIFVHVRQFDLFSVFLLLGAIKMVQFYSNCAYLQLLEFINGQL